MAEEYDPALRLSHLRLFKQQADLHYASKDDFEELYGILNAMQKAEIITKEQVDSLFPELFPGS